MIENDLGRIVKPKTWTRQAIFCHSINCDCSKCDIFEEFKPKCQMRVSLLELIRILGLPDEKTYNKLLEQYYENSYDISKKIIQKKGEE